MKRTLVVFFTAIMILVFFTIKQQVFADVPPPPPPGGEHGGCGSPAPGGGAPTSDGTLLLGQMEASYSMMRLVNLMRKQYILNSEFQIPNFKP